jgi:nicotinamide mononucleotide transporter
MENFLSEYSRIIEITGTIAGILGVWLTIRQNIWCFPVGIVNVLLYSWLTYESEIFANALLQLVYMAVLIYGWFNWTKGKTVEMDLPVSRSSRNLLLTLAVVFVLVFAGVYFVLVMYTKSDVPVADSFTFSLGIIAQYLIARKKIENWHLWIIVNVVSIGLYVHKELYLMAGFYLLLIIMAVMGYKEWKKDLKKIQA